MKKFLIFLIYFHWFFNKEIEYNRNWFNIDKEEIENRKEIKKDKKEKIQIDKNFKKFFEFIIL